MAEQSAVRTSSKPEVAWFVVAVRGDDVALVSQSAKARILTREAGDDHELYAEAERAEARSVEAEVELEEELMAEADEDAGETSQPAIRTAIGHGAVLGVLESPAANGLLVVASSQATITWLEASGQSARPVVLIRDLEAAADEHAKDHAREPLARLRAPEPIDALDEAVTTASRAFWALNADVSKDSHGVTDRVRARILDEARAGAHDAESSS